MSRLVNYAKAGGILPKDGVRRLTKLSRFKLAVNTSQQMGEGRNHIHAREADVVLRLLNNQAAIHRRYRVNCPQCALKDGVKRTLCCRPFLRQHLLDHRLAEALGIPHPLQHIETPGICASYSCDPCKEARAKWKQERDERQVRA